MKDDYGSNILPSRAIYPSSRLLVYVGILFLSKFFLAFGLFLSYDLLKVIHLVQFLCTIKAGAALPLIILQKPFTSGKRISKNQWFRIFRHAFIGSSINLLWLFGLTLCGPLRTIALFEHSDLVVIAAASALFSNNGGGPAKSRGAMIMLMGVIALLLFDHDDKLIGDQHQSGGWVGVPCALELYELHVRGIRKLICCTDHSSHVHSSFITHIFSHVVEFFGWSDHKGGVVLLFLTLCLQSGYNSASKKLSVDVGGAKRLHSLSTLLSAVMLFPWAVFIYFTSESEVSSWMSVAIPLTLIVLSVLLVDFYIEAVVVNHLQPQKTAKYGTYAILVSAVFLGFSWTHPLVTQITTMNKLQEIITEDHVMSGGVLFSVAVFALATHILVSPNRVGKGSFIGYSSGGLPLYSFTGDYLQRTSHSLLAVLKGGLRQILEDVNSRKIFYFLCINLGFTFVELLYGVWTNSLGLISDGFHMLFDCSALVMGLYAAIMSRWKPTRIFSYGYDRAEVLSGFINGLFLVVIAFFVFTAALGRIIEPPEVKTEKLLTVSVIGLCVNLVGIMAFHSSHSHGHGGHGHSHGGHGQSQGSHGHSHGDPHDSHSGHNHGSNAPCETPAQRNSNMEGVFLHVLADTLGSVGVIISSILIEHFGWNVADPLCSLFIAVLIFLSVFPLLRETSTILLLCSPLSKEKQIESALQKVLGIEGVLAYRKPYFWSHTSTNAIGTIHIQVTPEAIEQKIANQVTSIFKEAELSSVVVQIEKELYFQHLSGLSADVHQMVQYTQHFKALSFDDSTLASIKAV